jgi:hypothetical protein
MTRRIVTALLLTILISAGFVAGRATADQPHMQSALGHLRQARESLEKATADKGGHREKALVLVRDAIAEVEAGIAYDRHH